MKLLYPLLTLGGALIGALVGIATRPSVLGVPIPLEALTSSVRADLPLKDELTNHLLLTGGIGLTAGLVVALAVGIVAASLRGARPLPNSPTSVPFSAATHADPNVLKGLDWKLGICTVIAVNVLMLASGFFWRVSVLPYLILGGVGFPFRFFLAYVTGEVYAGWWLGVVLAQILMVLVFSALPAIRAALEHQGNLRGTANLAAASVLAALIAVTAWDVLIGFSADLWGLFQEYGGLDDTSREARIADFIMKARLRYWCAILSTASVVVAVQWVFLRRKQRRLVHPA